MPSDNQPPAAVVTPTPTTIIQDHIMNKSLTFPSLAHSRWLQPLKRLSKGDNPARHLFTGLARKLGVPLAGLAVF